MTYSRIRQKLGRAAIQKQVDELKELLDDDHTPKGNFTDEEFKEADCVGVEQAKLSL